MSAHTPGPWVASPDPNGSPTDWVIGTTNESRPIDEVAVCNARDARLIAAAPELLAALVEMTDDYTDRFDMDSPSTNPGIKYVVKQARAAIAKAEGGAA